MAVDLTELQSMIEAEGPPGGRFVRSISGIPDPAAAFRQLFGSDRFAFWIDRASSQRRDCHQSIMGSAAGRGSEVLTFDVGSGHVKSRTADGIEDDLDGNIFRVLRQRLSERQGSGDGRFDFCGGYVGYLGYELKEELDSQGSRESPIPDAFLLSPATFVVSDHQEEMTYVIGSPGLGGDPAIAKAEADRVVDELAMIESEGVPSPNESCGPEVRVALDRSAYLAAIVDIQSRLRAGQAFQACLTNRFEVDVAAEWDPLDLYLKMREQSQAPEAGYLRMGDVSLLSSSPERFLRVDRDRGVITHPIKGTRPRSSDPASDRLLRDELVTNPKERAENVMIVDVLRNDLGRVCEFGSIKVDRLAEVESFAKVHQLVSTISGRLSDDRDVVDCLEACFPGGSMTGAPKIEAMKIIDSLEPVARGPYAGAFGWFGLDGQADLSIVIRSIVLTGASASVGAGGAITVASDPTSEYEEMLIKARPLLELLGTSK
jgi:para-aminobenzoate synthetase